MAGVEISDEMVDAYAVGVSDCAQTHEGRPLVCCTRAGLAAVAPLIGAQVLADAPTEPGSALGEAADAPTSVGDRATSDRMHVRIDPAQRFGLPAVLGISCDVVAGSVWAENSVDAVIDDYDITQITRGHVLLACWYVALYDGKRWRKRGWRSWANRHASAFAAGRYDEIPDPPGDRTP